MSWHELEPKSIRRSQEVDASQAGRELAVVSARCSCGQAFKATALTLVAAIEGMAKQYNQHHRAAGQAGCPTVGSVAGSSDRPLHPMHKGTPRLSTGR